MEGPEGPRPTAMRTRPHVEMHLASCIDRSVLFLFISSLRQILLYSQARASALYSAVFFQNLILFCPLDMIEIDPCDTHHLLLLTPPPPLSPSPPPLLFFFLLQLLFLLFLLILSPPPFLPPALPSSPESIFDMFSALFTPTCLLLLVLLRHLLLLPLLLLFFSSNLHPLSSTHTNPPSPRWDQLSL